MIQAKALAWIMVEKGLMIKQEFSEHVEKVRKAFMKNHPELKFP